MGQATRTTKLLLDQGKRELGGANAEKRAALDATVQVLNAARAFYIDFFLAHAQKLAERISYYSAKYLEMRERPISANESTPLGGSLYHRNAGPSTAVGRMELQRTLSWDAVHLSPVSDQGCHWQGESVSVESRELAQKWQEEGPAGIAWSPQPSNALRGGVFPRAGHT